MHLRKWAFMWGKLIQDWKHKHPGVPEKAEIKSSRLGPYYLLFEDDFKKLNKLLVSFDKAGIPLSESYIDVQENGLHYYPISIGQYGLGVFNSYHQTGDQGKKARFLKIADWFVNTQTVEPGKGCHWLTDVPKPEYGISKPWKSAFTQSRAISILLRAWQMTHEERYYKPAAGALIPFTLSAGEGGVAVDREWSATFYEEYVAEYPTRVLDGHLFALLGLFDGVRALKPGPEQSLARQLFDEGVQGLIKQLPLFDLGNWVLFNRCDVPGYPNPDLCTRNYMILVIKLLKIIHMLTDDLVLLDYHHKFSGYLKLPNILRMYRMKYKTLKSLNRI